MTERKLADMLPAYRAGDPAAQQEFLTRLEELLKSLLHKAMGKQIRSERETMEGRLVGLTKLVKELALPDASEKTSKALGSFLR